MIHDHPLAGQFNQLTPELVLDSIEAGGGRSTGRFIILNSYENRVYQLELDDGRHLSQSTAIIQWLDGEHPQPPLLPADSFDKARVLSWVYTVACEIHPLNNIGVTNFLKSELGADKAQIQAWLFAWFQRGFSSLETSIDAAPYCFGDNVTMADIYLVPMAYNALRFEYDLAGLHPKVMAVYEACTKLPAFIDAAPENQPDAI